MSETCSIRARLFKLGDEGYRNFQSRLMPTVNPERIIGVRTPLLRALAVEISASDAEAFMAELPHGYYEEGNLHAFLIERIRDYDACVAALDLFLPHVDNWATCDSMHPKVLDRHPERLLGEIRRWMDSGSVYAVRFAVGMLMRCFLEERFEEKYLDWVSGIRSEEYYIRMMAAWFFATSLAKQYDSTLSHLKEGRLDRWTHNKAIQKAVESLRISPEQKEYLKTLKK